MTRLKKLKQRASRFKSTNIKGMEFFDAKLIRPWWGIGVEAYKTAFQHSPNVRFDAVKVKKDGKIRYVWDEKGKSMYLTPSEVAKKLNGSMQKFKLQNPKAEFYIALANESDTKSRLFFVNENNKVVECFKH